MAENDLVNWLITRVRVDPVGKVAYRELLQECKEKIHSARQLTSTLAQFFPTVKRDRCSINGKQQRVYVGISLLGKENVMPQETTTCTMEELGACIPSNVLVLSASQDKLELGLVSSMFVNGNIVMKSVTFYPQHWELKVRDTKVDLQKIGIDNSFFPSKTELLQTIELVTKITLCSGKLYDGVRIPVDVTTKESVKVGTGKEETILRSNCCKLIVPFTSWTGTCRSCQGICFLKNDDSDHTVELHETDNLDMIEIFNQCFPNAPNEMQKIMQSQYVALGKGGDKRGIRWDKSIISLCLSLWIRSPKTYEDLRGSDFLTLPSGRLLRRYKNIVPQQSGINRDVFRWMYEAGKRDKVPPNGRRGLLIHDETKLQDDLIMKMENGIPKLVGWVDCGEEATNMRILKERDVTQKVASDVLQIYFLGYTGFRWPISHYPTTGVTASELYVTFWKIISELQDWGFYVDCILQDGGSANRQFINLHFTGLPSDSCFISSNIINPTRLIAFTQDFSHIVKKIRNGIIKSGNNSSVHTRKLQLNGQYILWQQWNDMVKWDRMTNSRLINHKITDAHLFPDSGEKMRNHLAEDMLDADALNLMKCYRSSLANDAVLDGAVALLEQTSAMIAIFRDHRPIRDLADDRLAVLRKVCKFFQDWRKKALSNEQMSSAERKKCILSMECCDDIESLLLSFPKVCQMHLEEFPTSSVIPARFNSDIIENHFCQQRGIHNGNATSMTYYAYCSTQHAIILGQSLKSKGRKSNAGLCAARPFSFYTNQPLKR